MYTWSKILRDVRTRTIDARQTYHVLHFFHFPGVDHLREVNQSIGHVMTFGFLMAIVVHNLQSSNTQLIN